MNVKERILEAINSQLVQRGALSQEISSVGRDPVTVNLRLTDTEKEEFYDSDYFDSENYYWEIENNVLLIRFTEDI